jgi:hypothetical protein
VLLFYFKSARILEMNSPINDTIERVNLTVLDQIYYVDSEKAQEDCIYVEDLKKETLIIIVCIPIIYFITMIVLISIYCKYRKVTNKYERLKEEKENSKEFKSKRSLTVDKNIQIEFQQEGGAEEVAGKV